MERDLSATAAVLDGKETVAGLKTRAPAGGLTVERFFTTPGVDPADELAWCYPDLRPYLGTCRFSDCAHGPEPGCAVTAAVVSGAVSDARFDSYRRLVGAS